MSGNYSLMNYSNASVSVNQAKTIGAVHSVRVSRFEKQ